MGKKLMRSTDCSVSPAAQNIASTCKLRAQTLFLSGLKDCYTTDHLSA